MYERLEAKQFCFISVLFHMCDRLKAYPKEGVAQPANDVTDGRIDPA
jgi:hypothetical protein